jgi:ABC-type uncharacterized transport system substrate-binding protein
MKMKRREFIMFLGGAAAWPLSARAQQPAMPVVGFLHSASPEVIAHLLRAYRRGLSETGFVEGRNVAIEYRWAESHNDRLPSMAGDLVRRQVSVIATVGSTAGALAAKAATTTIPIVFMVGVDPIEVGLVASLNRPGGNITGVSNLNEEMGQKWLEMVHELVPATTIVALLVNPANPNPAERYTTKVRAAAQARGLRLHVLYAGTDRELDAAFATLAQLRAGALVIGADLFFTSRIEQLAAQTVHETLPAIYPYREFVAAGGLMSYGTNLSDMYRQAGTYTGRILKGEKPADLPVQQSTKVELIINLKTAKALGLTIPLTLMGRADEMIE